MTSEALARQGGLSRTPRFLALWLPQTLAMTARGLTTFSLEVWVYQRTHSATLFALLAFSTMLPGVLAAPFIGWLVDRLGARRALLLADGTSLLITLGLLMLFRRDAAAPGLLYGLLGAGALVGALQWPAYTALVTAVAPREHLPRAASLMQLGYGGQQLIAPAAAGYLLGVTSVEAVVRLDAVLSALAWASVLALVSAELPVARGGALVRDLREAITLISRQGLLRLAAYVSCSFFPGSFVIVLATPLVLGIAGPGTLGLVMSVMGLGMVLGSVTASKFARERGGMRRLLRYDALLAVAMLAAGFATRPEIVAAVGFAFLFGLGGIMAEEQAIWQLRIPVEVQGRVFALRRALTWASLPLGYALAGPLADHVFKPAMTEGAWLARTIGPFFGVGASRGIALLLMCAGVIKGGIVAAGAVDRELRALDRGSR